MKLSAQALRALQELDETGRDAVEEIVRAHIRACRLNGFQPENLERVYQEAIEIIRLERSPEERICLIEQIRTDASVRAVSQSSGALKNHPAPNDQKQLPSK